MKKKNKDKEWKKFQENIQEKSKFLITSLICQLVHIGFLNDTIKQIDYDDDEITLLGNLTKSLYSLGLAKKNIFKSGDDEVIEYYKKTVAKMLEELKGLLNYE